MHVEQRVGRVPRLVRRPAPCKNLPFARNAHPTGIKD